MTNMLTYEDCKELKEAGFPLKGLKDWNMTECPFVWGHFKADDGESYIKPTLSELIEACGDDFGALYSDGMNGWLAEAYPCSGEGFSPEQAVKDLWLAINKKQ